MRYYGSEPVEALIAECGNPDPQVRLYAAWILGHTHDPRAFRTDLRLTENPDAGVRYDAAWALGILGDTRAIAPLLALIDAQDEEWAAHSGAAQGLACIGNPAVPALLERLRADDSDARMLAAGLLGNNKNEASINLLAESLRDENAQVRLAGIESSVKSEPNAVLSCWRSVAMIPTRRCRKTSNTGSMRGASRGRMRESRRNAVTYRSGERPKMMIARKVYPPVALSVGATPSRSARLNANPSNRRGRNSSPAATVAINS